MCKQGQARGFVDAAALGFDDAVLDLVAHAQAMAAADAIGFQQQGDWVAVLDAVQRHRHAFFKAHGDFLVP